MRLSGAPSGPRAVTTKRRCVAFIASKVSWKRASPPLPDRRPAKLARVASPSNASTRAARSSPQSCRESRKSPPARRTRARRRSPCSATRKSPFAAVSQSARSGARRCATSRRRRRRADEKIADRPLLDRLGSRRRAARREAPRSPRSRRRARGIRAASSDAPRACRPWSNRSGASDPHGFVSIGGGEAAAIRTAPRCSSSLAQPRRSGKGAAKRGAGGLALAPAQP